MLTLHFLNLIISKLTQRIAVVQKHILWQDAISLSVEYVLKHKAIRKALHRKRGIWTLKS